MNEERPFSFLNCRTRRHLVLVYVAPICTPTTQPKPLQNPSATCSTAAPPNLLPLSVLLFFKYEPCAQGSTDQRVAHKLKSCVLLASISSRQRARSTAETIALLRWREQCLRPSAGPPPQPQPQPQSRESSARRSSSDPMSDAHDGEVWTAAAAAAGEEEKEGEEANSAAAARAEARRLARVNAEILEVNRWVRDRLTDAEY